MKNLALFLAVSLLIAAVGCQENAVAPIIAKDPVRSTPVLQKMQINERVGIAVAGGLTAYAYVVGEITYELTAVEQASLKKELPIVTKPMYNLRITGKGEIEFSGNAETNALAKPNIWTFSGALNATVADGSELQATFKIEGTPYANAYFHMGFILTEGRLQRDGSFAEVLGMGGE